MHETPGEILRVCKFGGTSLCSAESIMRSADIITSDSSRRYIVVSAPGKRFENDAKITDLLYKAYDETENRNLLLNEIKERYKTIVSGLKLKIDIDNLFNDAFMKCALSAGRESAASRGEYLNALILSQYLGFHFVDSSNVIRFNSDGNPDFEKTDILLKNELLKHRNAVIPGFYGSDCEGRIKTFSRGGSDITGSLVAKAVKADIYENFTDVDGIMSGNPKYVKNTRIIDSLTYGELRMLAYMGACVIHEEAVFPLRGSGIPINIRNTFNTAHTGSFILEKSEEKSGKIIGISGKNGFCLVTVILESDMRRESVFLSAAKVFDNLFLTVEQIFGGVDSISFAVRNDKFAEKQKSLLLELCRALHPVCVEIKSGISLVAAVGGEISSRNSLSVLASEVADNGIPVLALVSGSSENIIIFAVEQDNMIKMINMISRVIK